VSIITKITLKYTKKFQIHENTEKTFRVVSCGIFIFVFFRVITFRVVSFHYNFSRFFVWYYVRVVSCFISIFVLFSVILFIFCVFSCHYISCCL